MNGAEIKRLQAQKHNLYVHYTIKARRKSDPVQQKWRIKTF